MGGRPGRRGRRAPAGRRKGDLPQPWRRPRSPLAVRRYRHRPHSSSPGAAARPPDGSCHPAPGTALRGDGGGDSSDPPRPPARPAETRPVPSAARAPRGRLPAPCPGPSRPPHRGPSRPRPGPLMPTCPPLPIPCPGSSWRPARPAPCRPLRRPGPPRPPAPPSPPARAAACCARGAGAAPLRHGPAWLRSSGAGGGEQSRAATGRGATDPGLARGRAAGAGYPSPLRPGLASALPGSSEGR